MKRIFAVIVTTVFLGASMPASAGDAVTITPNPVMQGQSITVTASDCVSGDSWEAVVQILFRKDGEQKYRSSHPADDDGTTIKKIKMKRKKFKKGTYSVKVDCIHEFGDGDFAFWYQTEHDLKVKKKR